jgi:nitric oxide reductase activation protein
MVQHLKRQFEAWRPERLRPNRQLDGDDLDLAAIVEAAADRAAGLAPSDKLYRLRVQRDRSIALACLIDLSGSTGARVDDDPRNDQVIEITRRTLVFVCEAPTVLDDRYAIFGFTGTTRKQCQFQVIQEFDKPYGTEDTRQALLDARQRGLATFAVTIDAEARDYVSYLFGPYQYVVVADAPALSIKLPDVYRHLTVR